MFHIPRLGTPDFYLHVQNDLNLITIGRRPNPKGLPHLTLIPRAFLGDEVEAHLTWRKDGRAVRRERLFCVRHESIATHCESAFSSFQQRMVRFHQREVGTITAPELEDHGYVVFWAGAEDIQGFVQANVPKHRGRYILDMQTLEANGAADDFARDRIYSPHVLPLIEEWVREHDPHARSAAAVPGLDAAEDLPVLGLNLVGDADDGQLTWTAHRREAMQKEMMEATRELFLPLATPRVLDVVHRVWEAMELGAIGFPEPRQRWQYLLDGGEPFSDPGLGWGGA